MSLREVHCDLQRSSGVSAFERPNILINADGKINQQVISSVSSLNYGHDCWYAITNSGNVNVSTIDDISNGIPKIIQIQQPDSVSKYIGYIQPIDSDICKILRGKNVTISGVGKYSLSNNIRWAIIEWVGPVDSITRNLVNVWSSTSYTPGNFFISSNIIVNTVIRESFSANILKNLTNTTIQLGSTFNNLFLFYWTETPVAQNTTLQIRFKIEVDTLASSWLDVPFNETLEICKKYYNKTFSYNIGPNNNVGDKGSALYYTTSNNNTNKFNLSWKFPVLMKKIPIINLYNPSSGTINLPSRVDNTTTLSVIVSNITNTGMLIETSTNPAQSITYYVHATANAFL